MKMVQTHFQLVCSYRLGLYSSMMYTQVRPSIEFYAQIITKCKVQGEPFAWLTSIIGVSRGLSAEMLVRQHATSIIAVMPHCMIQGRTLFSTSKLGRWYSSCGATNQSRIDPSVADQRLLQIDPFPPVSSFSTQESFYCYCLRIGTV